LASFIGAKLQGQKTASGELYDGAKLVAAHPSYPMGTVVRVTNQDNGRVVQVKVIDRSAAGRDRPIIDVSRTAAERLDFVRQGTVKVTTEVIEWGTAQPR
jgi:rare lipoprotein A